MKKATKTEKTTTPAQPAPVPVKKTVSKSTSVKTAGAPAAAKPAVVKAVPLSVTKEVLPVASPVSQPTLISAQIDVGFGNTLYIRGDGPGLSWETGVPLDCVADDKWTISFSDATKPVVFKFLINDEAWCMGDDFVATPGSTLTVVPAFQQVS